MKATKKDQLKRKMLYIQDEVYQSVKKIVKNTGRNMSYHVNEIMKEWLLKNK